MQSIKELENELAALETRRDQIAAELATAKSAQESAFNGVLAGAPTQTLTDAQSAVSALELLLSGIGERAASVRAKIEAEKARIEAAQLRANGERSVFESLRAYEAKGQEMDAARDEVRKVLFDTLPRLFELMDETREEAINAKQTLARVEKETVAINSPELEPLRKLQAHDLLSRVVGRTGGNIDLEMLWSQLFKSSLKGNVLAAAAKPKSS